MQVIVYLVVGDGAGVPDHQLVVVGHRSEKDKKSNLD